jgi:hypothetical protein
MNATWKAVLGIVLIFVIGCICGALTASLVIGHRAAMIAQAGPPTWAKLIEPRLTRGMDIDDTQKQQIYDALVKNLQARVSLRKELAPRVQELNKQTLAEIDAVLKPDQQQKFLDNYSQFRARGGKLFNTGVDTTDTISNVGAPASAPQSDTK